MPFPNFSFERKKILEGYQHIVGTDEAGVACLAGPVVAGSVILDIKNLKKYHGVLDSKLLTPEKRFELEPTIKEYSVGWGIGVVEPKIIDSINIHHASLQAMKLAVED